MDTHPTTLRYLQNPQRKVPALPHHQLAWMLRRYGLLRIVEVVRMPDEQPLETPRRVELAVHSYIITVARENHIRA